jgi:formate/nitrite transporter FocA (FNT family)
MIGMDDLSPEEDHKDFRARYRTWGLRFYAGAFISIGFLFLARAFRHMATLHLLARIGAGVVGALAVAMGVLAYSYHLRYRRALRRARLNPRTLRRRL